MALQIVTNYVRFNLEKNSGCSTHANMEGQNKTTEASRAINNDYPHTNLLNAITSVRVQD